MRDLGADISKRQVVRLPSAGQDGFLDENRAVLRAGLATAAWITVADTGARHADLKAYCRDPTPGARRALRRRFDRLFKTHTGFATLDRLLARLHANRDELLMVLDRPDVPLHTNDAENDIRCQVTRRKISGGTRSAAGRDARDAFLGLMKTCAKLGIRFWDYLGCRLDAPGAPYVAPLPQLIRQAAAT